VQAFPSVLQLALSAVHVPLELHEPLQHCAFAPHVWPSETQAGKEHTLPEHVALQQSPD